MSREKVFVAASITGGRERLPFVITIMELLRLQGCKILSPHNGAADPVEIFTKAVGDPAATNDASFYQWNVRWIEEAELFVAEMTTPSHGVGAEFEHCRLKPRLGFNQTPMLCLFSHESKVSPHLTGVSETEKEYIWFRPYRSGTDLAHTITQFLAMFP